MSEDFESELSLNERLSLWGITPGEAEEVEAIFRKHYANKRDPIVNLLTPYSMRQLDAINRYKDIEAILFGDDA